MKGGEKAFQSIISSPYHWCANWDGPANGLLLPTHPILHLQVLFQSYGVRPETLEGGFACDDAAAAGNGGLALHCPVQDSRQNRDQVFLVKQQTVSLRDVRPGE